MNPALTPVTGGTTPALVLDDVTKTYGGTVAASSLDLTAAPGELVTLIGPSGCGKSTTLRLVAGLERPDAGTIRIAGDVVAGGGTWQPPERRRVGLVFQDHALFPHLTVAQNIAFGLDKMPRRSAPPGSARCSSWSGSGHLAARYPHELSGGEQQRVALARALAPRPAVVLLDEPFSSLDENLRAQVRADTVAVLRETGTTAMLVTHDQTEALSIGDRVVVMRDGVIEQVDTPEKVFEAPGDPVRGLVHGRRGLPPRPRARRAAHLRDRRRLDRPGLGELRRRRRRRAPSARGRARPSTRSRRRTSSRWSTTGRSCCTPCGSRRAARCGRGSRTRVRHPVGTAVAVSVVPGITPTLLVGDEAVTRPRPEVTRAASRRHSCGAEGSLVPSGARAPTRPVATAGHVGRTPVGQNRRDVTHHGHPRRPTRRGAPPRRCAGCAPSRSPCCSSPRWSTC